MQAGLNMFVDYATITPAGMEPPAPAKSDYPGTGTVPAINIAAGVEPAKSNQEKTMNWDQAQGKWKQMRGSVRQKWAKLTDNDLDYIAGSRERFIGKLQERYGIAKEEAQTQADQWLQATAEAGATPEGVHTERGSGASGR